jgi:hypothetical protein
MLVPVGYLHSSTRLNDDVFNEIKLTPWPEYESKLNRPSDFRLSTMLVLTFPHRGMSRNQRDESPTAVISVF